MSQSLCGMFTHLVYSTKHRRPWLSDLQVREEMHSYLGGISKRLECPPIIVGGVEDHVHILAMLGRSITLEDWIRELKRSSSIWIKKRDPKLRDFYWQGGYAVFSISHSHVPALVKYIQTQEEHHKGVSFLEELRTLLQKFKIPYDERYLWD